jgi:hypothetical protein
MQYQFLSGSKPLPLSIKSQTRTVPRYDGIMLDWRVAG